jgi:hypothetical protein
VGAVSGEGGPALDALSADEHSHYEAIMAEGQAAADDLNRAHEALRRAEQRVLMARGALLLFGQHAARRRGLDPTTIRIELDGRILPTAAEKRLVAEEVR